MQREELNPDIEIKYDHLITHMTEKNAVVGEFVNILKEICDANIFYSRTMEKFANNISKLMIGKDPLKEVFIIFERLIGAKAEQAMEMAKSIKDDMIPFVESAAADLKEQGELRSKQKIVKDMKTNVSHTSYADAEETQKFAYLRITL
jgi:hypothetical protein